MAKAGRKFFRHWIITIFTFEMAKEIPVYYPFYDFTIADCIERIHDAMGDDLTMRICSGGGSVFAAYGMYAKIKEHGNITMKVDGVAASAAGIACLFASDVQCLNVSKFMLHRADMYVRDGDQETQNMLDDVNRDIKSMMKKRLNQNSFKEITGMSIDDMFEGEQKDVWLNAKQAKQIGLVSKIVKLEPAELEAMEQSWHKIAATLNIDNKIETQKITNMSAQELKEKFPAIYNEVFQLGASFEKDRIESFMAFIEVDAAGVKAGIESGKPITAKQISEFTLKSVTASAALAKLAEEGKNGVSTTAPAGEKTEKDKVVEQFEKDLFARMGLGKKDKSPKQFGYVKLMNDTASHLN